jgi:putative membrane protein
MAMHDVTNPQSGGFPRMRRSPVIATFLAAASLALVATAQTPSRPAAATPPDDPTIIAIFDAANTADIETGALAAQRAQDPAVREFGAMLARDHDQVRQLGRDLAKKLGVTPTAPKDDAAGKAHAAAMASLRAKTGAEFDRAFLQHEAAFHKSVIDAVNTTLLPAIRNEQLRALVVKVAPAFQAHMLAAQNLEKKLASASSPNRYR